MSIWNSVAGIGVQYANSPSERRSIYFSNAISLVLSGAGLVLFVVYYFWYGWNVITMAIPIISLLILCTPLFNWSDLSFISRIWLCLFVTTSTMALSVYSKVVYYGQQQDLDYFTFRIIILSTCVFPPIFFSIKEKGYLISTSAVILLILMLHDPIHSFFGVPYRSANLKVSNYGFTNVVIFIVFLVMTGAVVFMKWISEVNELKALALIDDLNKVNLKLQEKNHEVEVRNEEISKQADHIHVSRQKLTDAYKIIEEQRNLLFVQNKNLSTELVEKNKELTETNTELIKHNNELRQFSFTVSHNLRGPVASLMGLMKLFDSSELSPANREIYQYIEGSTQRLDNIIKDLGKIIDIRHDIFQIRQQIDVEHEINEILEVLNREIETNNVSINLNLNEGGILYSVRPMVHSILYNLISNAIKYRSSERKPILSITTHEDKKHYLIEVEDNGLGIDLSRDKDNMFRLYKRFHHHTEGKGLGLYLVKLQAEALGGSINVESEVNKFTRFIVKLRKPENAERQILYQESFAEIFFDARINCIGTTWHKEVTSEQYATVTRKILDFVKVYNTPNYISDYSAHSALLSSQFGSDSSLAISEAVKQGLSRIVVVFPDTEKLNSYENREKMREVGITIECVTTMADAVAWIEKQNLEERIKVAGNA